MDIKGLLTNWIVKNVALAVAITLAVVLASSFLLGILTQHGRSIEVPDFTNMMVEEAEAIADKAGIRVEVYDTIFVRRMERGAIFSQDPAAGTQVKNGRKISLTINAKNIKKVPMPELRDQSLRVARAELRSKGFYLRKITFKSDMADKVLDQQYKGKSVRKGTMLESGSYIDLVVGLNDQGENPDIQTMVPNVVGMKYLRAMDALHDNYLNATALFDKSVTNYSDSLDAVVYKQGIEPSDVPTLKGESVSIYLSVDPDKSKQ